MYKNTYIDHAMCDLRSSQDPPKIGQAKLNNQTPNSEWISEHVTTNQKFEK